MDDNKSSLNLKVVWPSKSEFDRLINALLSRDPANLIKELKEQEVMESGKLIGGGEE